MTINLINRNCPICLEITEAKTLIIPDLNPEGNNEIIQKYWSGAENENKNILGLMPHPERMVDQIISNEDGTNLFASLLN